MGRERTVSRVGVSVIVPGSATTLLGVFWRIVIFNADIEGRAFRKTEDGFAALEGFDFRE
jgi:hypothetical protein